jgi:hypothetical protein
MMILLPPLPVYLELQVFTATLHLFFEGLVNFFVWAGLELQSSYLCLSSTWDDRCEPLCLAFPDVFILHSH